MSDITLVLQAAGRGDDKASSELLPLVYDELRRSAAARMAQESTGKPSNPTHSSTKRDCAWSAMGTGHGKTAELLTTTDQTIESIAREVGYQNPFVFSNAFTKSIGWRPSEYRLKRLVAAPSLMRAA